MLPGNWHTISLLAMVWDRRERTETVLIAKTAYKVYAEYTAHPLARLTLWSVLEQIGTIEARERDSAPMVASFKECKAGAIYIKNEKLERSF